MSAKQAIASTENSQQVSATRKKSLGAYYTPSNLSRILCQWAIRSSNDSILEPSFGGCNFLDEIALRLKEIGAADPLANVHGCDIDTHAFEKLKALPYSYPDSNFLHEDFLSLSTENFCSEQATAVIGNPPYIGHAQINEKQKGTISAWKAKFKTIVDARSSLWVYFILHSLEFIKPGGRIALVLPGSFLSADYSKKLHTALKSAFEKLLVISLSERIFLDEGAEERTVILLARGFNKSKKAAGDMRFHHAIRVTDISQALRTWNDNSSALEPFIDFGAGSFVTRDTINLFAATRNIFPCVTLGTIASINIGIVTGDTKFFIRTQTEWTKSGIDKKYLKFVVPKIKSIQGIHLTPEQASNLVKADERCLLLNTKSKKLSAEVLLYLSSYPEDLKQKATYTKRAVWHQPDDEKIPDGFMSFLTHYGPRLVINSSKANCTNSVHRVFFNACITETQKKTVAISILSSFTQLHAEIIGRPCGSGALKLEPKDAMALAIILPTQPNPLVVDKTFEQIQFLLSANIPDEKEIRKLADSFLKNTLNKNTHWELDIFDEALNSARNHRKGELK
ncbi:class I SAM-dependent DNA methyltransferase [Pseudomonas sp. SID14000]|uniref:HsdM family class I SAM-dependent methyltransferase n=1 Tax=Pseudomonas sp. SID14000 TaxID=1986221 RepID=UPI00148293AF|nr:N-6 DNA methylase [Pseudomonas sp. SID14000]